MSNPSRHLGSPRTRRDNATTTTHHATEHTTPCTTLTYKAQTRRLVSSHIVNTRGRAPPDQNTEGAAHTHTPTRHASIEHERESPPRSEHRRRSTHTHTNTARLHRGTAYAPDATRQIRCRSFAPGIESQCCELTASFPPVSPRPILGCPPGCAPQGTGPSRHRP